ncbi:MAG: C4-dicarboxylate transporter DcuC [Oscillospiraceae bacterium]
MDQIITYGLGASAVIFVVVMLIKKIDIKITLFAVGIILIYISLFTGRVNVEEGGILLLTPLTSIISQFKRTLTSSGFVILILGGYSSYMSSIKANEIAVNMLTKPLKKVSSVYTLIPVIFLLGNLLSIVIPSASNLAIILLATLYPVLKKSGMSTLTAAAIISTTATIIPTPLGSDNVAVAQELGMHISEYVFRYHAIISIPTLIIMAFVHIFWQKRCDNKDLAKGNVLESDFSIDNKEDIENIKNNKFLYSALPFLPIILLIIIFTINIISDVDILVGVELVTIISFIIAIFVEFISSKEKSFVLKNTETFFKGMGNSMGIVSLLVAASVFVEGLTSIGIIKQIQVLMESMSGAGFVLPIIMVIFTAIIVLLSGSGIALFFAMIPLIVPLAAAAGISPEALSIPMGLAGNLLRAVSPVSAVVVIVAGATKENPLNIVRRTSVPMIFGTVFMLVLSMIMFI